MDPKKGDLQEQRLCFPTPNSPSSVLHSQNGSSSALSPEPPRRQSTWSSSPSSSSSDEEVGGSSLVPPRPLKPLLCAWEASELTAAITASNTVVWKAPNAPTPAASPASPASHSSVTWVQNFIRTPTHPSAPSGSTDRAVASSTSKHPLLDLPDRLLEHIWYLLDPTSRASLYHSCKTFWTGAAFNSCINTCVAHGRVRDILNHPRHAAANLTSLRMVHDLAAQQQPSSLHALDPAFLEDDEFVGRYGSGYSSGSLSRSTSGPLLNASAIASSRAGAFVELLQAARLHTRAMQLLSSVQHCVLQGRGQDGEQSIRLATLLGGFMPNLTSLQFDWCCVGSALMASLNIWLPQLTSLSLISVNTADVWGSWPTTICTWSDIAALRGLTHLEVVDSHIPFLELGVQDISPLTQLTNLSSLRLVWSEQEHAWPGSKPCYLLIGLDQVSRCCNMLKDLVLDGVQLAKAVYPRWPSLTNICLGFISGWHPALLTCLQLEHAARLRHLTLGPCRATAATQEAKMLFATRLERAATSLAMCAAPPTHMELQVPSPFTDGQVQLSALLQSLAPLAGHLNSLSLQVGSLSSSDSEVLAATLPHLTRLHLTVTSECCMGLGACIEHLPGLTYLRLQPTHSSRDRPSNEGVRLRLGCSNNANMLHDGNVLSVCYAAYSTRRTAPLVIDLRGTSSFAQACVRELQQLKPASRYAVQLLAKC